jgi:pyruvate formate lyase activating enzyme
VDLGPILDNLRRLDAAGAKLVLRCLLLPGINDAEEDLRALADLSRSLAGRPPVELLPYHRLGEGKRALIGEAAERSPFQEAAPAAAARAAGFLRGLGIAQVEPGGLSRADEARSE